MAATTCRVSASRPKKSGLSPTSHVVLEHEGESLHVELEHSAHNGVHTGGHLWVCSCHLARWLFSERASIRGHQVIELGCGLGLPSLVASRLGAIVLATDALEPLMEKFRENARVNSCAAIETMVVDFTERSAVARAIRDWDLVIFADCVYGGQGSTLPSAIVLLMQSSTRPCIAVGCFPVAIRAGTERFWTEAERVGLLWDEVCSLNADSFSRLFIFRCSAKALPRAAPDWGECDASKVDIIPLFESDDEGV
mmetsp:Transcript_44711/g.95087  ORF Transcript_44711/g.95087 Transcript_44711/m.95087 type:complete len:253 (-) Transcript_44711:159-917(-)